MYKNTQEFGTLQYARSEMNYWREAYQYWREALGRANKFKDMSMMSRSMRNMNRARADLRKWIKEVEIHLGV